MKTKTTTVLLYVVWLIAAIMLVVAAAAKHPDSYYALLRWVCCAVFVYSALISFQIKRMLWLCIFGLLAVVFNPLFVLPLDRSAWIVVDWISIAAMILAAFIFSKTSRA